MVVSNAIYLSPNLNSPPTFNSLLPNQIKVPYNLQQEASFIASDADQDSIFVNILDPYTFVVIPSLQWLTIDFQFDTLGLCYTLKLTLFAQLPSDLELKHILIRLSDDISHTDYELRIIFESQPPYFEGAALPDILMSDHSYSCYTFPQAIDHENQRIKLVCTKQITGDIILNVVIDSGGKYEYCLDSIVIQNDWIQFSDTWAIECSLIDSTKVMANYSTSMKFTNYPPQFYGDQWTADHPNDLNLQENTFLTIPLPLVIDLDQDMIMDSLFHTDDPEFVSFDIAANIININYPKLFLMTNDYLSFYIKLESGTNNYQLSNQYDFIVHVTAADPKPYFIDDFESIVTMKTNEEKEINLPQYVCDNGADVALSIDYGLRDWISLNLMRIYLNPIDPSLHCGDFPIIITLTSVTGTQTYIISVSVTNTAPYFKPQKFSYSIKHPTNFQKQPMTRAILSLLSFLLFLQLQYLNNQRMLTSIQLMEDQPMGMITNPSNQSSMSLSLRLLSQPLLIIHDAGSTRFVPLRLNLFSCLP
ncbi:hypothetical protein FGO68_gene2231 [Halteria grandinella]|uniref:Uncharacterized protein n=1 Tax=Halteria grandinella TaxID=5974 RepID=A0A8J8P7V9_HALGN|nr:hypothetical protein FGO68_gene2231 [Halteria grandinella]